MTTTIYIFIALALFVLAPSAYRTIKLYSMRKSGKFPKKGMETLDDVNNLLKSGKRSLAIYCYRLVYNVSLKAAVNEIRKIENE